MQLAEKQELVQLLNLYQADLLMDNDNNIREAAKHPKNKSAAAQYLLQHDESMEFTYKDKRYKIAVTEVEE